MLHHIAFPVVSEWYHVKSGDSGLRVAGFFANQMCQMLGGPPNRRGEAPTRDFHLGLRFPGPFTRADIHAGLTHVVLLPCVGPGITGVSVPVEPRLCRILDMDFGEFLLPRTRVNKVKRKRLR